MFTNILIIMLVVSFIAVVAMYIARYQRMKHELVTYDDLFDQTFRCSQCELDTYRKGIVSNGRTFCDENCRDKFSNDFIRGWLRCK